MAHKTEDVAQEVVTVQEVVQELVMVQEAVMEQVVEQEVAKTAASNLASQELETNSCVAMVTT